MPETETVTADQLSIGDRVLVFGLEWEVYDKRQLLPIRLHLVERGRRNDTDFGFLLTRLPDAATVERKVEPKTKQFLVTCELRDLARGDSYITTEERLIYTDSDGYGGTAWVVTKVEGQT